MVSNVGMTKMEQRYKIPLAPSSALGAQRLEKCRKALAPAFDELIKRSGDAGWQDCEVALAIADISDRHIEDLAKSLDFRRVTQKAKKINAVSGPSSLERDRRCAEP